MTLRELLSSPEPIVLLDDEAEAIRRIEAVRREPGGVAVRVVRGSKCATEAALHDEFAAALQFPGYYGDNWNALWDCITDLGWMPADGYLLCLVGIEEVLPGDPEGFGVLLEILRDAARVWVDPPARGLASLDQALQLRRPFRTVVSGTPAGMERARRVLASLPPREG